MSPTIVGYVCPLGHESNPVYFREIRDHYPIQIIYKLTVNVLKTVIHNIVGDRQRY